MMEAVSRLIRETLPHYLKSLPVPRTFDGFAKLSGGDVATLVVFSVAVVTVTYATGKHLLSLLRAVKPTPRLINTKVKKECDKVVDLVEVEDLASEKVCYCRCWKSSKFPLCDGTHNKHNEETGDNIGPLVVKTKAKK